MAILRFSTFWMFFPKKNKKSLQGFKSYRLITSNEQKFILSSQ